MPKWKPENEIAPEIAKDWRLGLTEQRLVGAMAVSPGMKLAEAAVVSRIRYQSARNAMCSLRNRLQQSGRVGLDCNGTQALVAAYLSAERRI